MGEKTKTRQLRVHTDVLQRILARAHYDQTPNGVIKELLDLADKVEKQKEEQK